MQKFVKFCKSFYLDNSGSLASLMQIVNWKENFVYILLSDDIYTKTIVCVSRLDSIHMYLSHRCQFKKAFVKSQKKFLSKQTYIFKKL